MSEMNDLLYRAVNGTLYRTQPKPLLDSATCTEEDGASGPSDTEHLRLTEATACAIHCWLETASLDDGETLAGRLYALFVGIFDLNKNGVLDADEEAVLDFILNIAWEYLGSQGVSDTDADALLNHWDTAAATRVFAQLQTLQADTDDADADITCFVWGAGTPLLDAASGAALKHKLALRHSKCGRIKPRKASPAQLSALQKLACRKLHAKQMCAAATLKRLNTHPNRID
ncbi:MAG: hypothetical protein PHU14_05380 [Methylovulum sp.]|nr:hypothetical protein [Methylovulum sp.]